MGRWASDAPRPEVALRPFGATIRLKLLSITSVHKSRGAVVANGRFREANSRGCISAFGPLAAAICLSANRCCESRQQMTTFVARAGAGCRQVIAESCPRYPLPAPRLGLPHQPARRRACLLRKLAKRAPLSSTRIGERQ